MWAWLNRLWRTWMARPRALEGPTTAQEAMAALRAERRGGADPERWREALLTFRAAVFSASDRERVWRRARRRLAGPVQPLDEIASPTADDLEALEAILRDLSR